ncbi:S8 family serine peptidase, partial [bacterium]|nr:S8 family serine peptidase [candidate division CSSED10-310 bacterium]
METKMNYQKVLYGLVFFIISSTFASDSSMVITVKFKPQTINIPVGQKVAALSDINDNRIQIKKYFEELSNDIVFEKLIPKAKPADTLYINEKGEVKRLNDWSQVFRITIPNSNRKMMDIIDDLIIFEDVEYAEPPVQIKFDYTPNDLHEEGNQWYLTKINAEDAWDITTGSSSIKIAVIEQGVASHTDVNDKLTGGDTGSSGYHGLMVAGVAGCETNNNTGLASLGYNVMIIPKNHGGTSTGIATDIVEAADPSEDDADIINCSFKTILYNGNEYSSYNYQVVEDAIEDAIEWGKIVVSSAGNPPSGYDQDEVPYTQWPAAYVGVIGVSATNSSDAFPSGYNYGSLVDLSAPGIDIRVLDSSEGYSTQSGTSFSSPLVSALAALILSNNNSLTPTQVQETMELSAVDLGTTGRDDYFGYGRIDAYKAVQNLYVPEVYSTLSSAFSHATSGQIVRLNNSISLTDDLIIPSGVTLEVASGCTLTMNSKKITATSGSFSVASGSVISPYIRRTTTTQSEIKGIHPTIASAMNDAVSGQRIYLASTSYSENVSMKSGVQVLGQGRNSTTLNGNVTFSSVSYAGLGMLSLVGGVTVNSGTDNDIYDLYFRDMIDINYGSGTLVWNCRHLAQSYDGRLDVYCTSTYAIDYQNYYGYPSSGIAGGSSTLIMYPSYVGGNQLKNLDYGLQAYTYLNADLEDVEMCGNTLDVYALSTADIDIILGDGTFSSCPPPVGGA